MAGVTKGLKARDPCAGWADEHAESTGGGSYFSRIDLRMKF